MEMKEKQLLKELNKIGIALSAEKDIDKLLEIILEESMKITSSDGGSLYIKEKFEGDDYLQFKITRNKSRRFPFKEFLLPMDKNSISGYVSITGESLNLKDVRKIPHELGLRHNESFEKQIDYKIVNMLVIPMKDYKGEIVGVLQLLNKKKEYDMKLGEPETIPESIIEYTKDEEEIILSLASQAAILLERTKLYDEIQKLFQSFTEAMVTTLDARDTTTSGHSRRLAGYAIEFAKVINKIDYGRYKEFKFSEEEIREIYYAALLHDVGKIGVHEGILLKKNRLSDEKMETIKYRFNYLKKKLELSNILDEISETEKKILSDIDLYYQFITEINQKGFINEIEEEKISKIASIEFIDVDGKLTNLLNEFEAENLMIKRGNLTDEERAEMNLHVTYSYEILKGIIWTEDLKNVPEIAGSHHEKIDGSGYPKGIKEEEISIQAKMLAILDIFEALTARDRPYKPPMPVEKAIDILKSEVELQHLDKELYDIFVKERIFELYKEELNRVVRI